jgi:hypothetical protein
MYIQKKLFIATLKNFLFALLRSISQEYLAIFYSRVQRSGLRAKKHLITEALAKSSFSQIIANLATNFGLKMAKQTLFS